MEHLDPHSQALFLRSTKCARRRRAHSSHPRATDRTSSLRESFAHAPCAENVNQQTCFHTVTQRCEAARQETRKHKEVALMSAVQRNYPACAAR